MTGGTLKTSAPSYIERPADRDFLERLSAGEFCYVLTSRQMGKSSLMARTAERLRAQGILAVIVDLTSIGEGGSEGGQMLPSVWYSGLARAVVRGLRIEGDFRDWWLQRDGMSEVQRFTEFLEEWVLGRTGDRRVVIFLDEIDATLKLRFTDDFFAGIRACYNARATNPSFDRLTFALLGVASPDELIKDVSRTPFNVGHRIALDDFDRAQTGTLSAGLPLEPVVADQVLDRIHLWTQGQPYLTQRLCLELSRRASASGAIGDPSVLVDGLVKELFFDAAASQGEVHFKYMRERILQDPRRREALLLYRRVLREDFPADDPQSLAQNALKLSGLVRRSGDGRLQRRNRIYDHLFDAGWVQSGLARDGTRRRSFVVGVFVTLLIAVPWAVIQTLKFSSAEGRLQVEALLGARSDAVPKALEDLRSNRRFAEPLLKAAYAQAERRSPSQVNAALGLALFGDWEPLMELTRRDPNPASRTAFINGYAQWRSDPLGLPARLEVIAGEKGTSTNLWDFRSAVCAAMALAGTNEWFVPHQSIAAQTMRALFTNDMDSGTHAAAECALIRWGQQPPSLPRGRPHPVADQQWFANTLGMTLVRLPIEAFTMGSDSLTSDERPPHRVTLDRPIFIADREVTVAEFRAMAEWTGTNHIVPAVEKLEDWNGEDSEISPKPECPVQMVSWFDAVRFCNWLSRKEGFQPCYEFRPVGEEPTVRLVGRVKGYRLPTEAEWEYACRAFSDASFPFGESDEFLTSYAWFGLNSSGRTWPAGVKLPNLLGIFDLPGSIWEWCQDWYGPYPSDPVVNPLGPNEGTYRVVRGGSWVSDAPSLRSAYRDNRHPGSRSIRIGFRCVWVESSSP